ncbi:MAG: hypothetical protein QOJ96_330 [Alphaproteobacteria bacterium]|nr:hypothetical protein [Alphaproteobacteria bacterium]
MRRQRLFWLLMIVGSIAFAAASIEAAVRVVIDDGMQYDLEMWKYARDLKQIASNPGIGHEHRPNSQAELMGVAVNINSKGLREREIPYKRTSDLRILMLGDSFTEGWGVPFELTFSKRIERLYAAHGIAAEVINAGVGNYNTVMEVNYFLSEGYKYQPDMAVLNYIPNDAEPVPHYVAPNPLMRMCRACVYLFGSVDTLLREVSLRPRWEPYYLGLYGGGTAPGWEEARKAIGKLAEYCKFHNIKLVIAHIPELRQLRDYPLQSISELVRRAAAENGAEFVDVLPELQHEDETLLWVSPSDPHPNARAHELIANALFRKLKTLN